MRKGNICKYNQSHKSHFWFMQEKFHHCSLRNTSKLYNFYYSLFFNSAPLKINENPLVYFHLQRCTHGGALPPPDSSLSPYVMVSAICGWKVNGDVDLLPEDGRHHYIETVVGSERREGESFTAHAFLHSSHVCVFVMFLVKGLTNVLLFCYSCLNMNVKKWTNTHVNYTKT